MKADLNEVEINGTVYIKKGSKNTLAEKTDGMDYCVIRTYSAGVHVGYLKKRDVKEVELINSRRIWQWSGACSLSQLAVDGSKNPDGCKISCIVPKIYLTEAIEILPCTISAKTFFEGATEWRK